MHQEIMQTPKGMDTDHINGDGLDNIRWNLRICTHSQNLMNRKKQNNNSSGYKGVSWYKYTKKWVAKIRINGELKHLGYYLDKEQAAIAYNEAVKKFFGTFGELNIQ